MNNLADSISNSIDKKRNSFYKGKGCEKCNNTGYKGRISVNEVLVIDNNIRNLINKKATATEIKEEAKKQGMTTMLQDGFNKAKEGITTIEEILRMLHE